VGALYRKIVPHYISHIAVFLNFNVDWLPDCGEYNMQTSKFMESNILPVYFYLKFKYMYDIFFKSKNTVESVCPINNNILEYYEKGYYTLAHIPNNNTIVRKGLELCILEGFNLPRKLILKDNLISNESVLSDYGYNLIKKIYNSFRVGEL
jgi:hypothetical protein